MSQQESSYFDPEQETVYERPNIDGGSGESYEKQGVREQTVHYVTPERSMLRGEKLIPTRRTKPYSHWVATALFLLMILIGGLIWGFQVRSEYYSPPYPSYYYERGYDYPPDRSWHHNHHYYWHHNHHHGWDEEDE